MAVRAVMVIWLIAAMSSSNAQDLTLSVFDLNWSGNAISLSNELVIDSAATITEAISFHPTDPLVYYARHHGSNWQIVSANIQNRGKEILIESPERLSEPRLTSDKKFISCITADKRELRKFSLASREWTTVYADGPVDRYVWMDDNSLLLISPGDPNQLQLVTLRPKKNIPVAHNVGRELQQSKDSYAFVHKLSVDSWSIKRINTDGSIEIVAETLPDADLFALLPGGKILMLSEDQIFGYSPATQWREFNFENARRASSIKSIGVNQSGDKLFVLFATP